MLGLWLHRHSLVQKSQQGSRSVTATALAALPFHLLGQQIPRQTLMQSKVQTCQKSSWLQPGLGQGQGHFLNFGLVWDQGGFVWFWVFKDV